MTFFEIIVINNNNKEIIKDKFNNHIKDDDFIEWEQVYSDDYKGTLKKEINRLLDNGKNIVFDVDVVGGLNLKKYFGNDSLSIFIDVPSLKDLESRLNKRGTDSENKIKERLEKAKVEISHKDKFDRV